eukprot:Tbor_TRINITY_DN4563_c0_g1::TRINITY_DN4563_c0_g1_i1::g.15848::m.15848
MSTSIDNQATHHASTCREEILRRTLTNEDIELLKHALATKTAVFQPLPKNFVMINEREKARINSSSRQNTQWNANSKGGYKLHGRRPPGNHVKEITIGGCEYAALPLSLSDDFRSRFVLVISEMLTDESREKICKEVAQYGPNDIRITNNKKQMGNYVSYGQRCLFGGAKEREYFRLREHLDNKNDSSVKDSEEKGHITEGTIEDTDEDSDQEGNDCDSEDEEKSKYYNDEGLIEKTLHTIKQKDPVVLYDEIRLHGIGRSCTTAVQTAQAITSKVSRVLRQRLYQTTDIGSLEAKNIYEDVKTMQRIHTPPILVPTISIRLSKIPLDQKHVGFQLAPELKRNLSSAVESLTGGSRSSSSTSSFHQYSPYYNKWHENTLTAPPSTNKRPSTASEWFERRIKDNEMASGGQEECVNKKTTSCGSTSQISPSTVVKEQTPTLPLTAMSWSQMLNQKKESEKREEKRIREYNHSPIVQYRTMPKKRDTESTEQVGKNSFTVKQSPLDGGSLYNRCLKSV